MCGTIPQFPQYPFVAWCSVKKKKHRYNGLDDRVSRIRFPAGAGNFSLHHCVQTGSGAHLASYPVVTSRSFPGVKRPGREADHSPLPSAEVKECVELCLLHGVVLC
jgi:hypothetical protein